MVGRSKVVLTTLLYTSDSQTYSVCIPFAGPALLTRTTIFPEKSMCQI